MDTEIKFLIRVYEAYDRESERRELTAQEMEIKDKYYRLIQEKLFN